MMERMEREIRRYEQLAYRVVGKHKHSAVKVCLWCKKALRGEGFCYKNKFYGIASHRCVQITPALFWCTHRCLFCWRNTDATFGTSMEGVEIDEPKEILDACIKAHVELLQGFKGNPDVSKERFEEAMKPKHVTLSLAGEPLLYPKVSELIEEILSRSMTCFVVTNGTKPEVLKRIAEPTQLYVTLPAPNKTVYERTCRPLITDGWERINESLSLLKSFSCNTVVRLTLVKGLNFVEPEGYARLIAKHEPKYVEVKSFMSVGFSRSRIPYEAMPLHEEIKKFAKIISDASGYKIKDEKRDSRVVLLER